MFGWPPHYKREIPRRATDSHLYVYWREPFKDNRHVYFEEERGRRTATGEMALLIYCNLGELRRELDGDPLTSLRTIARLYSSAVPPPETLEMSLFTLT